MKAPVASRRLYARAQKSIPGGVNSPVRACKSVGSDPLFIRSAEGAVIVDADGNRYIDYIGSWGPMILGHRHPAVTRAIAKVLERGTSFGAPTDLEITLAEMVIEAVPSVERMKGTSRKVSQRKMGEPHSLAKIVTSRPSIVYTFS